MTATVLETAPDTDEQPTAHTIIPDLPAAAGGYDGPTTTTERHLEAQLLATARSTVHPMYRRSPGDCLTLLYRAGALNVPVGIAVDHIYINTGTGRGGLSAQLMAYLLDRAGITWKAVRSNSEIVELKFWRGRGRARRAVGTVKYQIEEARARGIASREHWRTGPEDCLWARAMARGCRRFFTGIVMGMGYTPEEAHDMGRDDTNPDDVATIPDNVTEFLGQADDDTATPDLIRSDIMARVRKAKLWSYQLPNGETLGQHLEGVWRHKTAMEQAARADTATATLTEATDQAPDVLTAPAGEGILCPAAGCTAAEVLSTGEHRPGCTTAVQA